MKKVSPINIAGFSGLALILAFLFFYVKQVDISLIYYWQQTVPLSIGESLRSPGGISELLADRILELISLPILGFVLVSLLVLLVFFSLRGIFRNAKSNPLFYPLLLAALLPFIVLFAHIRLPFELVTSLTAGLLLALAYSYFVPRKLTIKFLFNFGSAIIVFLIAGVPGLIVFIQVLIIRYVFARKYMDLLSILPLLLIPLLYLPFNLSVTLKQSYLGSLFIPGYSEIPTAFYLSLSSPLLLFLVFLATNFVFSKFAMKRSILISVVGIIIVLGALFYSSRASYEERAVSQYRVLVASFNKDWDEVIQLAKEGGPVNNLVQTKVNRALYGQGRLLDDMFTYPQEFGVNSIFLDGMFSSLVAIHNADFYYELGYALETRHWGTEAQMSLFRHPIVLKQLVMSYIAIGQEETALKYLRVLSGSWNYRDWCDQIFSMLEADKAGEDPDIKFFRSNNPEVDFFAETKDPVRKLARFYSSNHSNKMAFDFLVAGHLLKHNVGALIKLLPDFKSHGYDNFPKAVEEALMIYVTRTGDPNKFLSSYSISPEAIDSFRDFSSLISNVDSRSERMRKAYKYKDTYWYYILFTSPYASKK